ncbi:MAG TPA: TonB-dependent receptor, partial [Sphingomicrobium sp.]
MKGYKTKILLLSAAGLGALTGAPIQAQTARSSPTPSDAQNTTPATSANKESEGALDDILVIARKKTRAERVQDVPIAITALGEQQIAEAHIVSLVDVGSRAPNVALSSNGTFAGVASFTIRGLGANSSIASVEPAVGTFVDGVYLGTNFGVVLDTFDLEGIEILRGPQGTLQGRNVTGGAVMVRTRRPGDVFAVRSQIGIESGPRYNFAASVEGPVVKGLLTAKLAGYYVDDKGYFENQFTGRAAGRNETWFVRPTVRFTPTSDLDVTAIYERGRIRGDGVVPQNSADPTLRGLEFNYNETGYTRIDWEALTVEANQQVGFGNGTITNIFGVRSVLQDSLTDVDGSTATFFHAFGYLDQRQLSNELRYAGRFGPVDLTTGIFYFDQHYQYLERRILAGGLLDRVYGGHIEQKSLGLFAQGDLKITPRLSATLGIRYSTERKDANIDSGPTGTNPSNCNYATKSCPNAFIPKFIDGKRWDAWTPKIGLDWKATDTVLLYGNWSKGVRSGGYNVRSTSTTIQPGPYDPENQNAFELGFKSDLANRRVRINGAAFYNRLNSLQRDISLVALPPETGVVTVVRNAIDADIYGAELDVTIAATRSLRIDGNVGYTKSQYRNARYDLSGDGIISAADNALRIPRLAPWTYSVGVTYTHDLTDDLVGSAHVDFGYRSPVPIDD